MNKGDLTKLCLPRTLITKPMQDKMKFASIQCKKIFFKSYRKFKIYFLLSKSVFATRLLELHISSTIVRWNSGSSSCTATL